MGYCDPIPAAAWEWQAVGSMAISQSDSHRRAANSVNSSPRKRYSAALAASHFVNTGHRPDASSQKQTCPLTPQLILQKCGEKRMNDESDLWLLRRLTHLHLNDCSLDCIQAVSECTQLQVLYLYSNSIHQPLGLDKLNQLSVLHLQDNLISDMRPIAYLPQLRKLHLERNRIDTVRGLEGCAKLEELHLSDQQLKGGEGLRFDQATTSSICRTLHTLIANGSGVQCVQPLGCLNRLTQLDVSDGQLTSLPAFKTMLQGCSSLRILNCLKNPLTKNRRFRLTVAGYAHRICELNGQDISDNEKQAAMARIQMQGSRTAATAPDCVQQLCGNPRHQSVVKQGRRRKSVQPGGQHLASEVAMPGCSINNSSSPLDSSARFGHTMQPEPVNRAEDAKSLLNNVDLQSLSLDELKRLMAQVKSDRPDY